MQYFVLKMQKIREHNKETSPSLNLPPKQQFSTLAGEKRRRKSVNMGSTLSNMGIRGTSLEDIKGSKEVRRVLCGLFDSGLHTFHV